VIWDDPLPRTPSGKIVRARLIMDAPGRPTDNRVKRNETTETP
jgi:acyl-coenzyme A synthetase/AMP-(fatty) acid ligase